MKKLFFLSMVILVFLGCKEEEEDISLACCFAGNYRGELYVASSTELDGYLLTDRGTSFLINATIIENGDKFIIDLGSNKMLDIPNLLLDVDVELSGADWAYFDIVDPFYPDEHHMNQIYPYSDQNFAITLFCTIENSSGEAYEILFMGIQQVN